ncbi:MAG: CDP-alcohol phosphatidyltransferase family protein [Promethearchaeota archaeon]|nr:MAG: CDP-alcohol phosphatidyltransferase family protein [Candidatus Lokiarchaeota archaeon]
MMIDNWLEKTKIRNALRKFVKKYLFNKISPNTLTLLGFTFGLTCALFIFLSSITNYTLEFIILSAIFMILSFFLDVLDGTLARLKKPSVFGGILDLFCDRTVEISIIIALVSTDPLNLVWPGLFSLAAIILCITVFLAMGTTCKTKNAGKNQKAIYYSHGIMERSETLIFLLLMTILPPLRIILLWFFAILVFLTALQRLIQAYCKLSSKEQ